MCQLFAEPDTQEHGGQTREWAHRALVTSPALPSSPLLFFSPPTKQTNSPFPSHASPLYLMPSLSSLSLSLSSSLPKIGPAVHQPSRSSPSCLPSPNEKPQNNMGHRSRERTGCVHNAPVAPSETIAPFFSCTLSPLLPGLEKTNLLERWPRAVWGGCCTTASEAPSSSHNCLKDCEDKHLNTPPLALTSLSFHSATPLFVSLKSHHAL